MQTEMPTPPPAMPESLRQFLEVGPSAKPQVVAKINYSHDAMIDEIIRNPGVSQRELARMFGYTEGWISQVFATDLFQAALAKRKEEIIDPTLKATVEERLKGLVLQSVEKLREKLEASPSDDLTLGVLQAATKALGYGAKNVQGPTINQQFVVQVPAKAESSAAWAERHAASRSVEVLPSPGTEVTEVPLRAESDQAVAGDTQAGTPTPAAPPQVPGDLLTREVVSG